MSASEAEQLWNEMRLGTTAAAAPAKGTGVPGLRAGELRAGARSFIPGASIVRALS